MSVALADVAASASPRARARRGGHFGRFCRHRTAARAFCKKGAGCLSPQGLTLAPDAGSRIVSADVARCLTEPCSDCGGYCAVTESAVSCSAPPQSDSFKNSNGYVPGLRHRIADSSRHERHGARGSDKRSQRATRHCYQCPCGSLPSGVSCVRPEGFPAHGTITGREALHLSRYGDCPCPTRFNTRWSDTATFSGGGNGCCNELPRPRTVPPPL